MMPPAATTSPALSTATAKASSRSWPVPSITRRHSSAPSTPANLTTVKSHPTPAFWIRPAARTFPPASTVTANAASAENRALPSMVLRHSSAPLAPSSLTTAKSASVPVFVIRPAATTFPPASTATARASSLSLAVPLTFVCQAQLSEHKSPAAHACTSAIVDPHFPSLLDIVISSLLALHHPVADGHSSHVALSGFDRQAIHRVDVVLAAHGVPPKHVALAIAVIVAYRCDLPVQISHRAQIPFRRFDGRPVHWIEIVLAGARLPPQDVGLAIAVDIADSGHVPTLIGHGA